MRNEDLSMHSVARSYSTDNAQAISVDSLTREPLAIIGIGCRFPGGATSPQAFWELLCAGVDATREVPADRWDARKFYDPDLKKSGKMNTYRGGYLERIDLFDAQFFGISPREAVWLDPQQRLLLQVTWEALEDAGQDADRLVGSNTGVFVGGFTLDYQLMQNFGVFSRYELQTHSATGMMMTMLANRISYKKLRRSLLGVPEKKATAFSKGNTAGWKYLESVVLTALEGYHATLESSKFEELIPQLDMIPLEMRSYAYEGAAIGLTALDWMLPWKKRLRAYMAGPGSPHIYMVHIGIGESLSLTHRRPEAFMRRLPDRVLCWLVMEGYGFNKGFFSRRQYIEKQRVPGHLSSYARRIFDQGLGRSIWFLDGGDVEQIAATVAAFPASRQPDLWVGIGVACTYVGGVDRATVEALQKAAGPHEPQVAMGAAFVAKGRQLAGNPVPHTDLVCEILWGLTAEQAANKTTQAFENLPADGPEPAFEILQQRLLAQFAEHTERVYQPKEINS